MADYYQLLGIRQGATPAEIRSAYKRLAMLYHPDRNPGNPQAEELFKHINEAYHVLADTRKKAQYDLRYAYQQPSSTYQSAAHDTTAYWKQYHRQQYEQWRQTQQNTYKFDKRYFRIQGLAIGVFLLIAGICFTGIKSIEYFHQQQVAKTHKQNLALIKQVHVLFYNGQQEEAFTRITQLQKDSPMEYSFIFAEDSLLASLRLQANTNFERKTYSEALRLYQLLQQVEQPTQVLTLQRIAECNYFNGQFEESIQALQIMLDKQPNNIDLIYRMALIYQDDLNDLMKAEYYLTLGKRNFKEAMTRQYGDAFMVVMEPSYVHDIYYDIFKRRAEVNIGLKQYTEAEKDCNWAVLLRPLQPDPYYLRAIAGINAGNTNKLCDDVARAVALNKKEVRSLQNRYCR
jgi:curved DNA-binding protein CbpA